MLTRVNPNPFKQQNNFTVIHKLHIKLFKVCLFHEVNRPKIIMVTVNNRLQYQG